MTIPEKIKAARLASGLTQQQLGELCGYAGDSAQVSVRRWEAGTRPVPTERLRIVAKLLNLTLDDLIPEIDPALAPNINSKPHKLDGQTSQAILDYISKSSQT